MVTNRGSRQGAQLVADGLRGGDQQAVQLVGSDAARLGGGTTSHATRDFHDLVAPVGQVPRQPGAVGVGPLDPDAQQRPERCQRSSCS